MKSVVITGEPERLWPRQFWAHKKNRTHNGGLVSIDFLVMLINYFCAHVSQK